MANGFARLVLPDDSQRGRWVSNLINLELFDVSNWKVLAGESLDIAGFSYRTLGFTLAGGTLTSSLGPAMLTAPTYLLNGGVIDTNVTLGGTGALTQASGTTVLRGSVATPNVAITGGTLQLAANERLASATTLSMQGGTLDLNGYAQTIGTLNGTGTVSLSSATSAGVLTVGGGSYAGAIVDGPQQGVLIKDGAGTLALTGTSSFSGPTAIRQGSLVVNGSLANSIVGIGSGATLGGSGTVGGIAAFSGGTVAPGNSIGTLNVAGTVSFASGSIYQVEANAAGQSDRIAAAGTATLQGGTVQVLAQSGAYDPRTQYTILTAGAGVTGRFAGVTSNFAFLTPTLRYQANEVDLTLTRNDVAFASIAANRNQGATANALQGASPGSGVYDRTVGLNAAEARIAFQALSGDIHASASSALHEGAFFVREAILDRLRRGGAPDAGDADYGNLPATYTADLPGRSAPVAVVPARVLDRKVFGVWGQGFGAFGQASSDGNAAGLTRQVSGFVLGADVRLENGYRIGVAGGYSYTNIDTTGRLQSSEIGSGYGAVYGGNEFGPIAVRLGATYADNSLRTRRAIAFAGVNEVENARYGGSTIQGFGELGYRIALDTAQPVGLVRKDAASRSAASSTYIEPFVGGAYVSINQDRFQETGGVGALRGLGHSNDVGTVTAGIRAQTVFDLGLGAPVSSYGLLGYRRAFGDVVPTALLAFSTGPSFVTAGIPIDRDALVANAGLDLRVAANTTIGVAYTGQAGQRAQDHAVKGNVTIRW